MEHIFSRSWLKKLIMPNTTSLEVNGITLTVGDTIQSTLHRDDFESTREEPEGEILGFEKLGDECVAVRIRRRVEGISTHVLLGISGQGWFRTFKIKNPLFQISDT